MWQSEVVRSTLSACCQATARRAGYDSDTGGWETTAGDEGRYLLRDGRTDDRARAAAGVMACAVQVRIQHSRRFFDTST